MEQYWGIPHDPDTNTLLGWIVFSGIISLVILYKMFAPDKKKQ